MQLKISSVISRILFLLCFLALQTNFSQAQSSSKDTSKIYSAVEKSASFPGGLDAFGKFLGSNLRYPKEARDNNIQGRVILTFIVEKDGSLTDIKAERSPDPSLSTEAVRVMSASPKWIPGTQNGKPVRVQYAVPIAFSLPPK
jgi:protein TonB